jgi:hypothetical protein
MNIDQAAELYRKLYLYIALDRFVDEDENLTRYKPAALMTNVRWIPNSKMLPMYRRLTFAEFCHIFEVSEKRTISIRPGWCVPQYLGVKDLNGYEGSAAWEYLASKRLNHQRVKPWPAPAKP